LVIQLVFIVEYLSGAIVEQHGTTACSTSLQCVSMLVYEKTVSQLHTLMQWQ